MKIAIALLAPALLSVSTAVLAQNTRADSPPAQQTPATTNVIIETDLGSITVALETQRAPISSANFLRYADQHRFDGTVFYRAMHLAWGDQPNGLIQGGTQGDPKRILRPIAHEATNVTGVKHVRGAISMARYAPGTATGDFSITLSEIEGLDADPTSTDPELQAGYAAFGHVVQGMDVVDKIWNQAIDPNKGAGGLKGQMLAKPVKIIKVRRAPPQQDMAPQ